MKVGGKKRSRLNPTEKGRSSLNGSLILFRQNAHHVALKSRFVGLLEYLLKYSSHTTRKQLKMLRNAFDTKTTKLFLFKKSKQNKQTKIAKTAKKKKTKAGALLQLKY